MKTLIILLLILFCPVLLFSTLYECSKCKAWNILSIELSSEPDKAVSTYWSDKEKIILLGFYSIDGDIFIEINSNNKKILIRAIEKYYKWNEKAIRKAVTFQKEITNTIFKVTKWYSKYNSRTDSGYIYKEV